MPARVLIIDDDRAIITALTLRLEARGYDVVSAIDGPTGLAEAHRVLPNVILLDIRMPGMDGFGVNKRLKADPVVRDIPVVFLSAHAQETDRQAAMAAGAKYFLAKPYDSGKLFMAIEAVMDGTNEGRTDALVRNQANRGPQTA